MGNNEHSERLLVQRMPTKLLSVATTRTPRTGADGTLAQAIELPIPVESVLSSIGIDAVR